jgi:hypothetical protein
MSTKALSESTGGMGLDRYPGMRIRWKLENSKEEKGQKNNHKHFYFKRLVCRPFAVL